MGNYILRRLLLAIPTLMLISVLAFMLSYWATDDPVAIRLGATYQGVTNDPAVEAEFYRSQMALLHLDKPGFYFGVYTNCYTDTLYKVYPPARKEKMKKLARQCGNWATVDEYEKWVSKTVRLLENLPDSVVGATWVNQMVASLKVESTQAGADTIIGRIQQEIKTDAVIAGLERGRQLWQAMQPTDGWGWPQFSWYGFNNQYNDWLMGRYATEEGSPWKKIIYSLRVTLLINISAILISLILGIIIGMQISGRGKRLDQWSRATLMVLYVIPLVLLGCLFRYLFATKGAGLYLPWIGGIGTSIYSPASQGFGAWAVQNINRIILPVLVLSLHFTALIALQMRTGMLGVLHQDFIRTAKAKGLATGAIYWRHAFKNALFPVITIAGGLMPFAVSGAVVTETIFQINGLGYSVLNAFLAKDFGVLMSVIMLTAFLTIIGSLISDIIYAWIDPRVKLYAK